MSDTDIETIENWMRSTRTGRVSVRKQGDKIRIDVDGMSKVIPYSDEVYEKLKALANEIRAQFRGSTSVPGVSDVALFQATVRGKKPIVEQTMEKLAWLQGAILDFGSEAMIAILLASGENPDNIPEIVARSKDKDTFVNYMASKLYSIISAARECGDAAALRDEVLEKELKLYLLEEKFDELASQVVALASEVSRLRRMHEIALALMDQDQLERYSRVLQLAGLLREGGLSE